jgi:hypothetical protein
MSGEKSLRDFPKEELSDYHTRQAAHLRALVETATTRQLKARLLEEAQRHERIAAGIEPNSAAERY